MSDSPARREAIQWAKQVLDEDIVILDFETTGFKGSEIVQIGAIDRDGITLMDVLVKPQGRIPPGATNVHGITDAMVQGAPGFRDLYTTLSVLLAGKHIVAYNADFEQGIISGECKRYNLPLMRPSKWSCAMKTYAGFYGKWNPRRGGYTWQSLGNACTQQEIVVQNAHSAIGDCLMTLKLIEKMAEIG